MSEHLIPTNLTKAAAAAEGARRFAASGTRTLRENAWVTIRFNVAALRTLQRDDLDQVLFHTSINESRVRITAEGDYRGHLQAPAVVEAAEVQLGKEASASQLEALRGVGRWMRKIAFSSARFNALLAGADDLMLYSCLMTEDRNGTLVQVPTLTAIPKVGAFELDGLTSLLPCPPHCGGDDPDNPYQFSSSIEVIPPEIL